MFVVWFGVIVLFSSYNHRSGVGRRCYFYTAEALTATRFNDNNKLFPSSSSPLKATTRKQRRGSGSISSRNARNRRSSSSKSTTATTTATYSDLVTELDAKYRRSRSYRDDDEDEEFGGGSSGDLARQRSTDRPTQTWLEVYGPPIFAGKPKIVVLGATGKIGR